MPISCPNRRRRAALAAALASTAVLGPAAGAARAAAFASAPPARVSTGAGADVSARRVYTFHIVWGGLRPIRRGAVAIFRAVWGK